MTFFKGIKIVLKYEAWQKVIQPNKKIKKNPNKIGISTHFHQSHVGKISYSNRNNSSINNNHINRHERRKGSIYDHIVYMDYIGV